MMELSSLFRVVHPPASTHAIESLRKACGILPTSYETFLAQADGAEWCVNDRGGDCLALWRANKIEEMNAAYEIPRYLADFLAIGSDGGGYAIGFDRAASPDPERWPVVLIGFGDLDRNEFVQLADGFQAWCDAGCPLRTSSKTG